jgi:HAD superfamily hydrolase (TIGR01484 family)
LIRPSPLSQAELGKVSAVFADVDGTLTTDGRLTGTVLRAIEWLVAHRVEVVLVSGRPSSWGECWIRQLPVAGVIVENGALAYARDGKRLKKLFAQSPAVREKNKVKLARLVTAAIKKVKGSRISSDSIGREVDLAIDYAEDARLGPRAADALEAFLEERGVTAVRSSVHVNCWIGPFDKRSAVRDFLQSQWKVKLRADDPRYVYVGDSFNDAPMFEAFALSVGVANVADVLDRLEAPPKFITRAREGRGFCELVDAIARARKAVRP